MSISGVACCSTKCAGAKGTENAAEGTPAGNTGTGAGTGTGGGTGAEEVVVGAADGACVPPDGVKTGVKLGAEGSSFSFGLFAADGAGVVVGGAVVVVVGACCPVALVAVADTGGAEVAGTGAVDAGVWAAVVPPPGTNGVALTNCLKF